uniref:Uncharacterized protein n=1 Tax=Pyrodinium bahamense TaxID=73915 RepID=A0A7S0A5H6_9DINO
MSSWRSCALLTASVALAAVAVASDGLGLEGALAADDECLAARGSGGCMLSALQRRASRDAPEEGRGDPEALYANETARAAAILGSDGKPWTPECGDCMQGSSVPGAESTDVSLDASPIRHYALDCWTACGGAGSCNWCGPGNACCRYMRSSDPAECRTALFWPSLTYHTCVMVRGAPSQVDPSQPAGDGYHPLLKALALPSAAPILTFYMYRAMGDSDYPPENVNTASLGGVMWYLHNEVVVVTPRKFGITRIVRYKLQTKAPQPLLDAGMNFGVRYAFDSGRCTGPWNCQEQFNKYGFFVGCNYVSDFPTVGWRKENRYPDAIWYSLPGPCSTRQYAQHDETCVTGNPGGSCSGDLTGRGDCTYTATMAGEIRIDELEGISDYNAFIRAGKREYIHRGRDRGIGLSFWDGKVNPQRCRERVQAAERLFAAKYPDSEQLETPKCDFSYSRFFHRQ